MIHTPLATGADQIAARAGHANGYRVRALLPFAPDEYEIDFAEGTERLAFAEQLNRAESSFALPGNRQEEQEAYVMVGRAVIAASDVILAIWDGREAMGPGGTAHVVDIALRSGVPVIHIPVDRDCDCLKEPNLLVGGDAMAPGTAPLKSPLDFDALLRDVLLPHGELEQEQLEQFYCEREVPTCFRLEYPLLLALLGVRPLGRMPWKMVPIAEDIERERRFMAEHGIAPQPVQELAYGWANSLAIRYALLFRSGHVANYALSALAVVLALFGLVWPDAKLYLVIGELVVIGLLFLNTRAGKRGDWHRRWLQYRHLAESLRPLAYLRATGLAGPPFRSDWIEGPMRRKAGTDWTHWYAAASWRSMQAPVGTMDQNAVRSVAHAAIQCQVLPQAQYHETNAHRMHQLDHALHRVGGLLMTAVILTCGAFIAGYFLDHEWTKANTGLFVLLTAGLPAVGAAVFGMRGHGEHLLTSRRSAHTAAALLGKRDRLAQLKTPQPLAEELEDTAAIMLEDLDEWTVSYQVKSLEIPA